MKGKTTDCWEAFGSSSSSSSSSEDEEEAEKIEEIIPRKTEHILKKALEEIIVNLIKQWSLTSSLLSTKRHVGLLSKDEIALSNPFQKRGFQVDIIKKESRTYFVDVAIYCLENDDDNEKECFDLLQKTVVPGGFFIIITTNAAKMKNAENYFSWNIWCQENSVSIENKVTIKQYEKHACEINLSACTWKYPSSSSSHKRSFQTHEYNILKQVTIPSPAKYYFEKYSDEYIRILEPNEIKKAITSLETLGFCIIRNLLPHDHLMEYSTAARKDMTKIIQILSREYDYNLLNPSSTSNEKNFISNFREMAMREELRVDLRHGPSLSGVDNKFCKDHPSILKILTQTMSPRNTLREYHLGNYGKWNFNQSGPSADPTPPIPKGCGCIFTFPSCGDQAIHADTPHLVENIETCSPPHYINCFMPCFTQQTLGGTAFIASSHYLNNCKEFFENKESLLYKNIVRPDVTIGDVILFDCRLLHFGMANRFQSYHGENGEGDGWRPMLYVNWMQSWFTDPKNWENEKKLFPDLK